MKKFCLVLVAMIVTSSMVFAGRNRNKPCGTEWVDAMKAQLEEARELDKLGDSVQTSASVGISNAGIKTVMTTHAAVKAYDDAVQDMKDGRDNRSKKRTKKLHDARDWKSNQF